MNKRILTILCIIVLIICTASITALAAGGVKVATVNGIGYTDMASALAAVDVENPEQTVLVLEKAVDTLTIETTTYMDLNGFDVAAVTVKSDAVLYCLDSETDDYSIEGDAKSGYTGFGRIAAADGAVLPVEAGMIPVAPSEEYRFSTLDSYMKVSDAKGISFHRVNLQITAMTLRPKNDGETDYNPGLYYKSNFAGDQLVAENVNTFGIALSLQETPEASNMGVTNQFSWFSSDLFRAGVNSTDATSTFLKSILKESNPKLTNTFHTSLPIFGRAYIQTKENQYVFGIGVKRTFQEQIELMCEDTNWNKLTDDQEDNAVTLYKKYMAQFREWDVPNLEAAIIRDAENPVCDGRSLKLLAITSSFGLNTTQLLYDVAVAEGIPAENITIGRLYTSGCTLKKHLEHAPDKPVYQYTKISGNPEIMEDTGKMTQLMAEGTATLLDGLLDEDWDIIYMQQGAAQAPRLDTYSDYIDQLKVIVDTHKTNPNAKFVWNMLWGYQGDSEKEPFVSVFNRDQMAMYEANVNAVQQKVVVRNDFDAIIPTGTVVQNARSSFIGDHLCRDTYHLNNLGGAFAAYGLFATLTGRTLTEINLDFKTATDTNGIVKNANNEPLTEAQKAVIIEAVNNAMANPFHVTKSAITTQP